MSAPKVSVVIPAYNARVTVLDSVKSALAQTLAPLEVIVIDDGSTDGTGDAVRETFGESVDLITQANRGVAEARNRGVSVARGEFVQFLDSDDMLVPGKLRASYDACAAYGCEVAYGPARYVAEDGRTPVAMTFPPLPSGEVLAEWLTGTMSNGTYGVASSMFVRRDALMSVGGFEKDCTPCEDWDMWIRLAAKYRFAALDQPLVIYRIVPGSLSSQALRMARGRLNTVRRARELTEVKSLLGEGKLNELEAGRWHVYAVRLWESGKRAEARAAFTEANRMVPSSMRSAFRLMSYALPAKSTATLSRVLQLMRGKNPTKE